jgi:ABC-type antimicrobial peptide transport system permease subunit
MLVDIPWYDPMSIAGAVAVTVFAGLLGCMLPAIRAARVEPADALRT